MKRIFFFIALGTSILTSCGSDDNTSIPTTPTNPSKEQVTAKWKMVKGEVYQNGTLFYEENLKGENCEYSYYDLKSNGTKAEVFYDAEDDCDLDITEGIWTYNQSKKQITLTDSEDGYTMVMEVVTLSATEAKFKLVKDGDEEIPTSTEIYVYLKK